MDAQDFRSLQEAYMEVVENQQLDEELTGVRAKKAENKGFKTLARGQEGSRIAKNPSANLPTKRGGGGEKGKPKVGARSSTSDDQGSGNKTKRRQGKKVDDNRMLQDFDYHYSKQYDERYDLYDIILSHLLDEGYAETQEQAEVIMVNMSEDWRESILSEAILEYQPFKDKRKRVKSKVKKLESQKSEDPKDLGFRNARLQKRIDSMKAVLGKKNKEITSASQQKSYDSMAKGGFKHHDDPQSKYYIK